MGFGFEFFEIIFFAMFALILLVFIFVFIKGFSEWHKNNNSPRLTVDATVVSKRTNHSISNSGTMHTHTTSTSYYATFQVESGDRMEFNVGREYGMLVEGDIGRLTFQGTRYISFER